MTRTFFPRGKFPRRNSVLKWVPRSIACKLDLANCTRECRSIPSNLIFQGLSRSSVDPWQVRANKFFHHQSYYTGSLCNVITSSYYIPIRYLSLEPPTVEPAAIDWFALPFSTLRPFCPPSVVVIARGRDYRVRHPCQIDFRLKIIQISRVSNLTSKIFTFSPQLVAKLPKSFVSTFGSLRDRHVSRLSLVIASKQSANK